MSPVQVSSRRRHLFALAAAGIGLGRLLFAAAAEKIPRIGLLTPMPPNPTFDSGLDEGLREFGYVDGRNILIVRRYAYGNAKLQPLAQELLRIPVDLIVTASSQAARVCVAATRSIPIVFPLVGDPVAIGIVESLARPGANATGVALLATELAPKRLDILKQLIPSAHQVVHIINLDNPSSAQQMAPLHDWARTLGITLDTINVRNSTELDAALRSERWRSSDAALIGGDVLFVNEAARIARAVREAKLPAIFPWREFHEQDVLASYGPSLRMVLKRGAYYVDRILRGAKPGDPPVEQVSQFDFVINVRVAREMGIRVPDELLYRAGEVLR